MKLPVLTTRRLMVYIAVTAILFGGMIELPRFWNLRQEYLGIAEKYGYWETRIKAAIRIRQEITYYSIQLPRGPEPSPGRLAQMEAKVAEYSRLREKYERAARSPWLPVASDPPEPK
jgi:hypothetical protein